MKIFIIIAALFIKSNKEPVNYEYLNNQINIAVLNFQSEKQEYEELKQKEKEKEEKKLYKGESRDKIAKKINRYLKGSLKGKGNLIVDYSISKGVDPYLAAAVMLQETGCYWGCSYLTRTCNNVAGNKGTPSCNGGSYRKFSTIDEGIKFSIRKLASFYKKGKTTAKQINDGYAEDKTWYVKVNNYIKKLKS